MSLTGAYSGKLTKVFRGDGATPTEGFVAFACLTSNSLSIVVNALQQACKDSGAWDEAAPDTKSMTVQLEMLRRNDVTIGVDEIWTDIDADTSRNYQIHSGIVGTPKWNFSGFFSQYDENDSVGEFATASATLTVVGQPTRDLVT